MSGDVEVRRVQVDAKGVLGSRAPSLSRAGEVTCLKVVEVPSPCAGAPARRDRRSRQGGRYRSRIRVLVVEDDPRLADVLARGLHADGLIVDVVPTGRRGLEAVAEVAYDVVILDVGLPDMDGFAVCRKLRERRVWTPVLMLTARDQVRDRVDGLDAGADDYVAKPFHIEELLARLRALTRRGPVTRAPVIAVGDLRLNPATHEVWRGEAPIELSLREFALLEALMRHPGQVLSRDVLLDQAWPAGRDQRSNVVEVYVRNLREKIDRPFGVASIENVRGAGYRLRRDGGR